MLNLYPNTLFNKQYRLLRQLGHGGFSEVWLVYNERAGIQQALKVYMGLDQEGLEVFRAEFARMYNLSHPHLLKASEFNVFQGYPYLLMPYCQKGSALGLLGKMKEADLAKVMHDIGAALAFIHHPKNNLIHKDVKPDNLLIHDNGDFLLSDFGISTDLRNQLRKNAERRGTPTSSGAGITPMAYRAPEYFDPKNLRKDPIIASDIWAFGVCLVELATGKPAFGELGGSLQYSEQQAAPNLPGGFSGSLNYLLKQCMARHAWDRPQARELRNKAAHYLRHGQWPTVNMQPRTTYNSRHTSQSTGSGQPEEKGNSKEQYNKVDQLARTQKGRQKKKRNPLFAPLMGAGALLLLLGLVFGAEWVWESMRGNRVNTGLVADTTQQIDSMALLNSEELEGISPQDSIIVPPAEVASAKTRQEQEEIKPESPESKAVSYSYFRPYVQQAPGDNSNSDCEIRIEEVKLGISETEIRMSLKGCFQIDLFGPDNTRYAFYLRDPSRREYKLRRFRDIASGREIQVGSQKTFSMYFDPLPRDTRSFDLMEGHVQHAQNRNWWNFKGVELKHKKQ